MCGRPPLHACGHSKTAWLDGKHVVFGRITEGLEILDKIEAVKTASADRPVQEVLVTDSGVLPQA